MYIARCNNRLVMLFAQCDYFFIKALYILNRIYRRVSLTVYHEHIIADRLYFKKIIKIDYIIYIIL